jgi:hypothetical protein
LEIESCSAQAEQKVSVKETKLSYRVELKDGFFTQKDLDWFLGQQSVTIERKGKRGRLVVVELKRVVSRIGLLDSHHVVMTLGTDKNMMVRPAHVIRTVFHLTEQQVLSARITKLKANHV